MKQSQSILRKTPLFADISDADLGFMLSCLGAEEKSVPKNGVVLLAGEKPSFVGVALSGVLHVVRDDYDGNRTLVTAVSPGELFAEALCCAGVEESPVTVLAGEDAEVLTLQFGRILRVCPTACSFHAKLIENMLKLVAGKNLYLQSRMDYMSIRSVRAKVTRYLESFIPGQGRRVTVPFNREDLAAYLGVERSALSHELSKMKKEGLLDYKKNEFSIKW